MNRKYEENKVCPNTSKPIYLNRNKIYVGEKEIYPEHYKECGGSIVASLIKSYHRDKQVWKFIDENYKDK